MSKICSETGASVMMCHHMTKVKDDTVISTRAPDPGEVVIPGLIFLKNVISNLHHQIMV